MSNDLMATLLFIIGYGLGYLHALSKYRWYYAEWRENGVQRCKALRTRDREKAAPDEPMFVLLARDPLASDLVRLWAERRSLISVDKRKVIDAFSCADAMEQWRHDNPPEKKL